MNSRYTVADTSSIFTPALLFYRDLIQHNIEECLELAGCPDRLRPHCKTHKTRQVVQMLLEAGITKHKCATLAEAEMLAGCGVRDILLAYNMVGPNCARLRKLVEANPDCWITVLADHPSAVEELERVMEDSTFWVGVMVDIDVGQHRTGLPPGDAALALYQQIDDAPALEPRGLHVYDGHNHQTNYAERETAVRQQLEPVLALRDDLLKKGIPVPALTVGGTPTFPIYAKMDIPNLELSPGTCLLHDHGYGTKFPDMNQFLPAAVLLTRVISKPTPTRLTLDLGYKAVASDPPAGNRLILLDMPGEYQMVLQNEEHLVIETPAADRFQPGDEMYAIPTHICPTCALHRQAYVIENGQVVDSWDIIARDRMLTV